MESNGENVNEATNIENFKYRNRQKKVKNTGSSPHVLTMNMCAYIWCVVDSSLKSGLIASRPVGGPQCGCAW